MVRCSCPMMGQGPCGESAIKTGRTDPNDPTLGRCDSRRNCVNGTYSSTWICSGDGLCFRNGGGHGWGGARRSESNGQELGNGILAGNDNRGERHLSCAFVAVGTSGDKRGEAELQANGALRHHLGGWAGNNCQSAARTGRSEAGSDGLVRRVACEQYE